MDPRWRLVAATAAAQHGAFCIDEMTKAGVSRSMRSDAVKQSLIARVGPRTFRFAATPLTWELRLVAAVLDAGPDAYVAGRSGAELHRLDGFRAHAVEGPRAPTAAVALRRRSPGVDHAADPGDTNDR